jgi:threonine/homoserine/homoserine lactone efflux protein
MPSIDPQAYVVFLTAAVALILTPGPDTVFVLTQGVSAGKREGVASALGVSTGILVHTTAAALGLAALLRTSAVAYAAIKYAGAAYLLYLGAKTFRQGGDLGDLTEPASPPGADPGPGPDPDPNLNSGPDAAPDVDANPSSGANLDSDSNSDSDLKDGYLRGVTVNVLNPKVALFFLAFLPQFVGTGAGSGVSPTVEMVALGGTYAVLTALYLGTVGLLSGGVRTLFRTRPRLADGLRWVSGSVLVGLGAALALESR